MNPPCAKCSKTVYPTEKLNCLDKSWHKGCFTCEACGMTLNMKNYKGYNKLPYCHAHYPTTKFTTVADTPENRRLAKNTKTQSQVEYQKQFVQDKGHKISVADDPETVRARRNTQNQSSVVYTGQLQQREIAEQHRPPPEEGLVRKGNIHIRQNDLKTIANPSQLPVAHHYQPPTSPDDYDPVQQFESAYSGNQPKQPVGSLFDPQMTWHKLCFKCETCSMLLNMKNYKGYNKLPYCNTHYPTTKFTAVADTPENLRLKKQSQNQSQVTYHKEFNQSKGKFTAVADDPESMRLRKVSEQASNIAYKGQAAGGYQSDRPSYQPSEPQQAYQPPPPQESYQPPPPQSAPVAPPPATGPRYVAIYDYTAADSDEVSFVEGDVILDGEIIDAGWMTGTVARTGEHGMLPSNYVEQQ